MKGIEIILLAVGGVVGTFLRYRITESPLLFGALPINVLIVNIIGSFVLGMFVIVSQQWSLDGRYALFVAFGFAGALTTMSAFALETTNLLDDLNYVSVVVNVLTNVGLSIGAIIGGRALMTALIGGIFS